VVSQYRRVVGNISLSLDGRVTGPGGPFDMGWIVPHAVTEAARRHMLRVTAAATGCSPIRSAACPPWAPT
jgi:hypothetical protein